MKLLDIIIETVVETFELKYSNDEVSDEAKKYKTRQEFKDNSRWAYDAAKNRKMLDKVCSHMPIPKRGIKIDTPNYDERITYADQVNGTTDDDLLKKGERAAKEYESPVLFQTNEPVLYKNLSDRGLLHKIEALYKKHLVRDKYTYEDLKNIILKKDENGEYVYKTKRDLEQGNPKAYHTAYASPYWEELTDHMIALGNKVKRMIYVYEFPDLKTVYVGLTGDEDRRKEEHQTDPYSALYRFMEKNPGLIPTYKRETLGYIDVQEASKMESEVEYKYRNAGWTLLNVAKTGGLGKMLKYTDELFRTIAKNYSVLSDFWREHRKMINTVVRHRKELYDEVVKDMLKNVQPVKVKNDKNFNLFLNSEETDMSQLSLINFKFFYNRITPENRDKFLMRLKSIIEINNLKLSGVENTNTILSTNKSLYNGLVEHDSLFPKDRFIPYLFPGHRMTSRKKTSKPKPKVKTVEPKVKTGKTYKEKIDYLKQLRSKK